jgi:hypothetical protein
MLKRSLPKYFTSLFLLSYWTDYELGSRYSLAEKSKAEGDRPVSATKYA